MLKKLLIISFLWGVLILILSSIPGNSLPKSPTIPHFDKIVHAGLYFILASFLIPVFDLSKRKHLQNIGPLIVLLIVALYGGSIEIAQEKLFVNRSGDFFDFYSDLAGGILALILYYLFVKKLLNKRYFIRND